MSIYWVVTGVLIVTLYTKYCDDKTGDCDEVDNRFIALPVMCFVCVVGWVSMCNVTQVNSVLKHCTVLMLT